MNIIFVGTIKFDCVAPHFQTHPFVWHGFATEIVHFGYQSCSVRHVGFPTPVAIHVPMKTVPCNLWLHKTHMSSVCFCSFGLGDRGLQHSQKRHPCQSRKSWGVGLILGLEVLRFDGSGFQVSAVVWSEETAWKFKSSSTHMPSIPGCRHENGYQEALRVSTLSSR